jgi:hypothetical protein
MIFFLPEIAGVKVPSPITMDVPRIVMVKSPILAALLDSNLSFNHCALLSGKLGDSML